MIFVFFNFINLIKVVMTKLLIGWKKKKKKKDKKDAWNKIVKQVNFILQIFSAIDEGPIIDHSKTFSARLKSRDTFRELTDKRSN